MKAKAPLSPLPETCCSPPPYTRTHAHMHTALHGEAAPDRLTEPQFFFSFSAVVVSLRCAVEFFFFCEEENGKVGKVGSVPCCSLWCLHACLCVLP
jgi:hypothetical protein